MSVFHPEDDNLYPASHTVLCVWFSSCRLTLASSHKTSNRNDFYFILIVTVPTLWEKTMLTCWLDPEHVLHSKHNWDQVKHTSEWKTTCAQREAKTPQSWSSRATSCQTSQQRPTEERLPSVLAERCAYANKHTVVVSVLALAFSPKLLLLTQFHSEHFIDFVVVLNIILIVLCVCVCVLMSCVCVCLCVCVCVCVCSGEVPLQD